MPRFGPRKALVTLAVGSLYEDLEKTYGLSRQLYAKRHGYDYHVITEAPAEVTTEYAHKPKGFQVNLCKFLLPEMFASYDFVVFMDGDTVVNRDAPDLAKECEAMPTGAFAACEDVPFSQRAKFFPEWDVDYYVHLESERGLSAPIRDRTVSINGGLLAFCPSEVRDRWRDLLAHGGDLNEENRLNAFDVQSGHLFRLDPKWNVVWLYEKRRQGFHVAPTSRARKLRNRLANRLLSTAEGKRLQRTLEASHMVHAAFEHHKLLLLRAEFGRMEESLKS